MKLRRFLFLLMFLSPAFTYAQNQVNLPLKKQLDSILVIDQKYRLLFGLLSDPAKEDSLARQYGVSKEKLAGHLSDLQNEADTSNLFIIESVIKKYGYPGKSLVGGESSSAVWSVLQHSKKIDLYLPLIRQAAKKGELAMIYAAMMEDRALMYHGKEQIYGTQGSYRKLKTGKSEMIIFPIRDPEGVNERRKKAGFDTTVEENAKRLNITYRKISMDDLVK
ncbi:DUF6624 domain-containing protein [Pedobacter metabolipauper]|uniref:Uncharacterized protein n=1 Tax=Pedobacter metabolipauper TaxID=425513 RepID=A0A4R6T2D0_9SPHI|nr:DUF6624 domain-containing protein [Pedobacter metabolipauper]TDQ11858.1 hypothetical protein ATK78_0988 [Pedobacter metabolipauper]